MITSTTIAKTSEKTVGMGQIAAGREAERLRAILGSCIGLALYHPRLKAGALAHIVLPDSAGRGGSPGKFADTAVPQMLDVLRALGAPAIGLTAKFAGGANMFAGSGPLQVGDANVEAVERVLRGAGVRIVGRDVGGTNGRRVTFDCTDGTMTVERAGQPPRIL
jgi:chemotaxis protein CheD